MSFFDRFKKSDKKDKESEETKTLGWDAITEESEKAYPSQTNPKHYHPPVTYRLGGKDPLDGISVYDSGDY